MKYNSNSLLESLLADVRQILLEAEQLKALPASMLQSQPSLQQWSVAQVLEHLNIYSRYYIATIEQKLHLNQSGPNTDFTPGWLGNYFTNLMKPNAEKAITKKMKAPKMRFLPHCLMPKQCWRNLSVTSIICSTCYRLLKQLILSIIVFLRR